MNQRRTLYVTTLVVLAALILSACGPTPTPTPPPVITQPPAETPAGEPSPVATQPPTGSNTPVTPAQTTWQRVQKTGKLAVATSADYRPFEFYNENFVMDGFDIALMREIGKKLGVEVVFNDFAFDGLPGALQLGQADAVISALTITPARREVVDFSNTYYVGEDGALAKTDSTIPNLTSAEQLANYVVGVERGSVYESWITNTLVSTGKMPAENLRAYGKVEQAVGDLEQDRVEIVVMDLLPAQEYVQAGRAKLVGRGANRQQFGIAVRQGDSDLLAQINNALTALQNENVVAELSQQYLKLQPDEVIQPTPEPTATPEPPTPTPLPQATPTATPVPPCIDGMAWVADLNLDDKNMTAPPVMQPGQRFTKGWRIRNSGTCDWTTAFRLVYVSGNSPLAQMGGQPVAISRVVAPGGTYDMQVNLVAPSQPGTYQGFWQMTNAQGVAFGEKVWVGITVPAPATPTPFPTQTPAPNIQFWADQTTINQGACTTLRWNVSNVQAVYVYAQGQPWEQNGVAGQGERQVCPQATTVYELRAVRPDGSVEIRQVRIDVIPTSGAPVIDYFNAQPDFQMPLGQCVTLSWNVSGDVFLVKLVGRNMALWDGAPVNASYQDCPQQPGQITYVLEAYGSGGTARAQKLITVGPK